MVRIFLDTFKKTSQVPSIGDSDFFKNLPANLFQLLELFGNSSFNYGLYRIHSFESSVKWSILLGNYFKGYTNKIYPFGFDWMGRQFAINELGDSIFMFDPATMEDLVMKKDVLSFHNEELVQGLLAEELFSEILSSSNIKALNSDQCLGYKKPLFLGGIEEIENFQLQDIEVYWEVQYQLYNKVKDIPDGTKIGKISLD
jgi:hypothetical protein